MRKFFLAGNWKMNKLPGDTKEFFKQFSPAIEGKSACDVLFAVPYLDLAVALEATAGSHIKIAAQNLHWESSGAYTGEVSAEMLGECGVTYTLVGHSERRQFFGETNQTVNLKTKAALAAGIHPIVCVGETLEQREAGQTTDVVRAQVVEALEGVASLENLTLAYEPVWAIGTGKTATPEQAQEVHKMIRATLVESHSSEQASKVRLLYGGSAKPENIGELLAKEDIDGGLVGGASLEPNSFAAMVQTACEMS